MSLSHQRTSRPAADITILHIFDISPIWRRRLRRFLRAPRHACDVERSSINVFETVISLHPSPHSRISSLLVRRRKEREKKNTKAGLSNVVSIMTHEDSGHDMYLKYNPLAHLFNICTRQPYSNLMYTMTRFHEKIYDLRR